jgi:CCR4-NOT transcription complex subunit 4
LCAYEVFAFTGSSRSKISAPPGFSAPARVPPPGFSSGFPSQDGLNPPPVFSSGISSQDGPNPSYRSFSAFGSGLSSQDGPNPPSKFPSAFTSGFSSHDGSNQVYGSTYPGLFSFLIFFAAACKTSSTSHTFLQYLTETLLRDNVLGGNSNHYQAPFGRHTTDIEFNDPAILAVGKGRMPGIGDSGLEMRDTSAFPAQLQTPNNDPRFQLRMQQNVQSHQSLGFADHMQDAFNPMNDNYLASKFLQQNHGPVSHYAQMTQQRRNSQLTNGHLDGWSDLRQGNNALMSDMSRMLYPGEVNSLHMLGSDDIYTRAFGM